MVKIKEGTVTMKRKVMTNDGNGNDNDGNK